MWSTPSRRLCGTEYHLSDSGMQLAARTEQVNWIFIDDKDKRLPRTAKGEVYAKSHTLREALVEYLKAHGNKAFFKSRVRAVQGAYTLDLGERQPPDDYVEYLSSIKSGGVYACRQSRRSARVLVYMYVHVPHHTL